MAIFIKTLVPYVLENRPKSIGDIITYKLSVGFVKKYREWAEIETRFLLEELNEKDL